MSEINRLARERPPRCGILLVLLLAIPAALSRSGAFSWEGLLPMLAATGLAVFLHFRDDFRWPAPAPLLTGMVLAMLAAGIFISSGFYETMIRYQIEVDGVRIWKQRLNGYGLAIRVMLSVAFLIGLAYLAGRRFRFRVFPLLFVLALAARILMLLSSPWPIIDVMVSQTLGAKGLVIACSPEAERERLIQAAARDPHDAWTLRDSRNVYSMRFPSPYYDEARQGPRLDAQGRSAARAWFEHYGYPPLTVYMNALSWFLFRDVRGLWVAFDLVAAWCLYLVARRTNPSEEARPTAELTTLGFLFMPRALYVIEQSWTEPLVTATMGLLTLAMINRRKPAVLGVLLGLWLSSKQYVVLGLPPFLKWLGLRRGAAAAVALAVATGLLLLLPMALWDFRAMWHDVLGFFLTSNPRPDALSLVGMLTRWQVDVPGWFLAPLMLAGAALLTWRMKRNVAGWCFTTAATWLFFFMLGKQAFMNYFYVILYALWLAFAATPATEENA